MVDKELHQVFERIDNNKKTLEEIKQENEKKIKKNRFMQLRNDCWQFIMSRQEDHATERLVEYIEANNQIKTTKDDLKSEMWIKVNGIYEPNGESHIKEIVREVLDYAYTAQRANKVIAKIEADTFVDAEEFFKKEQENVWEIPVQNGVLNIKTKQLRDYSEEDVFFNKINATFDSEAKCPMTKKFLSEILKSADDEKIVCEIAGHCLAKKYLVQTAIMLLGDGENAKGTLINYLKKFLGEKNCSAVPLNQLTADGFSTAELFGKLANLAGDISNTDLKDSGRFKELTSGTDLISAKRKFLRDLVWLNSCKLIFSCNELPRTYDFTRGFWRRWVLLEFPYTFMKKIDYDKCEDKTNVKLADPEILEKVGTQEELSGFLNEALEGLERLIKNKQFSYTKGTAEVKEFWIRKSDSFSAFCLDHIEEDSGGFESKKKIRQEFNKYCKKYKIKGTSDKSIKVTLEDMFGVIESRKSIGGSIDREMCWEGIRFVGEKSNVKEVNGFSTYSQISNSYIGSNTIDTLDINKKEGDFTDEELKKAGFTKEELKEILEDVK